MQLVVRTVFAVEKQQRFHQRKDWTKWLGFGQGGNLVGLLHRHLGHQTSALQMSSERAVAAGLAHCAIAWAEILIALAARPCQLQEGLSGFCDRRLSNLRLPRLFQHRAAIFLFDF